MRTARSGDLPARPPTASEGRAATGAVARRHGRPRARKQRGLRAPPRVRPAPGARSRRPNPRFDPTGRSGRRASGCSRSRRTRRGRCRRSGRARRGADRERRRLPSSREAGPLSGWTIRSATKARKSGRVVPPPRTTAKSSSRAWLWSDHARSGRAAATAKAATPRRPRAATPPRRVARPTSSRRTCATGRTSTRNATVPPSRAYRAAVGCSTRTSAHERKQCERGREQGIARQLVKEQDVARIEQQRGRRRQPGPRTVPGAPPRTTPQRRAA